MTRCILSLLLTGVAVTGLSGCGKEPPVQVNHAEMQETPATVERIAVKSIDFDGDLYLKDVCRDTLSELPFKRFTSYDFIYNSPFPVKVSGAYYEVRARGAADAATIYEEIKATIFRDVEIVVEAKQTAPYYSFDSWRMPFAVSDHPFSASRQLQHQRAMGSTFPFLDLAEIPFHNSFESRQPDSGGSSFSRNFISVLNFLATRGEAEWGQDSEYEKRRKADELRIATTATEYERRLTISKAYLAALRSIPLGEKMSFSGRGNYTLIYLGKPARFIAAIDGSNDAVGLRACNSGQLRD